MADSSSLQSLLHCLDPISLIRSQNPDSDQPVQLSLTSESFFAMERGPRYLAYAALRESRLRARSRAQEPELIRVSTPPRKQVKFQTVTETTTKRKASGSVVAQSVPDFASVLRKENRKPPMAALLEMTPPAKSLSRSKTMSSGNVRGSKSASAGEKWGVAAARKSCANLEELKGFSLAAATAITGESRRGAGIGKRPVLGCRVY